ncbi:MAG: hypothetical protein Q4A61_00885 [Porphyromonadaceae bacterium]|nr:hypothetical protein [Porphyromonadaceae bacterium]
MGVCLFGGHRGRSASLASAFGLGHVLEYAPCALSLAAWHPILRCHACRPKHCRAAADLAGSPLELV